MSRLAGDGKLVVRPPRDESHTRPFWWSTRSLAFRWQVPPPANRRRRQGRQGRRTFLSGKTAPVPAAGQETWHIARGMAPATTAGARHRDDAQGDDGSTSVFAEVVVG